MSENTKVKIKLIFLMLTLPSIHVLPTKTDPLAISQGLVPVPQTVIDERKEKENNEVAWLNTLVTKTNLTKNGDGNIVSNGDRAPLGLNLAPTYAPETTTMEAEEPLATLECLYYNEDKCRNQSECEITTETCQAKDHLKHLGCHAIFKYPLELVANSTDKYLSVDQPMVKQMGCMEYQSAELSDCTSMERCEQKRLNMHSIGMCCCTSPKCNKEGNLWMLNPDLLRDAEESKHYFVPTPPPESSPFEVFEHSDFLFWGAVVLVLLVFIVLCCIVIRLLCCYRARKEKNLENKKKNVKVVDYYGTNVMEEGHLPLVVNEEVEMQPTPKELPISEWQLLTYGRYGQVYKAKWTSENGDEKWVAVKKMPEAQRACYTAEKTVFEELMQHPKWYSAIVQCICAEQIGQELWIVTEFQDRLSLYDLLKHNVISIASCNRIIMSMTDGLAFLHDTKPFYAQELEKKAIIHRDLKSKNILVKSDMTACIADFGLARLYEESCELSDLLGQVGTKRYMAPEMLEGAADYTIDAFKAMDVYSMGLVMWEVMSRTQLSQSDEVPEHKVPYHWLGVDPVLCDLRRTVSLSKERPAWRKEILEHKHMTDLSNVVDDMWVHESSGRTTSGYVFQKVWDLVSGYGTGSEGYHSSGSGGEEEEVKKPKDGDQKIRAYHKANGRLPHPSPDPINCNCPPVPMIPILTDTGIIHAPDAEPSIKSMDKEGHSGIKLTENSGSKEKPDTYYSVELQRVLTKEEAMPIFRADKRAQMIKDGLISPDDKDEDEEEEVKPIISPSRRSSVTPAGEF